MGLAFAAFWSLLSLHAQTPDAFNAYVQGKVYGLAVQSDGKVLIGGNFSGLSGQGRNCLGRVNADGSLDTTFNPALSGSYSYVHCLALQADGKILLGGEFNALSGQTRNYLGRINADGSLDPSFDPMVESWAFYPSVSCLAIQADGKILVGGDFSGLGGQPRDYIGRLNPNGSLDLSFNPGADGAVNSIALQPDGKIIVVGAFTTLGGQPHSYLGRLNPDGSVDSSFNPQAGSYVWCTAVQPNGQVLVGGYFTSLCGQSRNHLARLQADGSLDLSFDPAPDGSVSALTLQADGKILVSGYFATLAGQARDYLGRLNADGSLDTSFSNPRVDDRVYSLGIQADGKVLAGGRFNSVGGQARSGLARLSNPGLAGQSLEFDGSTILWRRGGTSPEVWRTTFDASTNRTDWVSLGDGQRTSNGWQRIGLNLPSSASLRARGYLGAGMQNGSSWFVETVASLPVISSQPVSRTNNLGSTATFSVSATGTPPLGYQWRKGAVDLSDGGKVSGAHAATLTLNSVGGMDVGSYSVVVTNLRGSVTSQVATLCVPDPVISSQPANQTNLAGTSASFSVAANGTAPLNYRWRKGELDLADGGNVSGAHGPTLSLGNVFGPDAGPYSVVVSNAYGCLTSSVASLAVLDPVITVQPASRLNNAGTTAGFSVTAAGTAPLNYQWRKDGTNLTDNGSLTGAQTATLTLPALGSHRGGYSVLVSNAYGCLTSQIASLTVVDPFITAHPVSLVATAGQAVAFTVGVAGTTPLSYQWRKDGTNKPGATTATLSLSSAQPADAGSYDVTVTNAFGTSTSTTATLAVGVPPAILQPPASLAVALGGTAAFNVSASGSSPLSYQWLKNNTNYRTGTDLLTLPQVTTNDVAAYRVVVANAFGSVTSSVATLSIPYPFITQQPSNTVVVAGDAAQLAVTAVGGLPVSYPLSYQWYHGTNVANGATNAVLSLLSVTTNAAGSYFAVVANDYGSVTSVVAVLTVGLPPTITAQPSNQTVVADSLTVFSVSASGTAPLSYQWQHNGIILPGASNTTFTLVAVQPPNTGDYRVVVTNRYGSVTSAVATLALDLRILSQPVSQFADPGQTVAFNVLVGGTAPFAYQWRKDGFNLSNSGNVSGACSPTLTLAGIAAGDAGGYSVVITNSFGSVTSQVASLGVGAICVDASARGSNDGSSWANAYTSLQAALAAALPGRPIRVAEGTYTNTRPLDLVSGVALYGGFARGGSATRDTVAHPTILSGAGVATVVRCISADSNTVLDGFTITAGKAANDQGGGMFNRGSFALIRNCTFTNNMAAQGAGMFNTSSAPTIVSCTFINNHCDGTNGTRGLDGDPITHFGWGGGQTGGSGGDGGQGAGIFNTASSPVIEDCTFAGNTAFGGNGGDGGNTILPDPPWETYPADGGSGGSGGTGVGIYNEASSPLVKRCRFTCNLARGGSGGRAGSQGWLDGCGSWGLNGGGYVGARSGNGGFGGNGAAIANASGSHPAIEYCTFAENAAEGGRGAAPGEVVGGLYGPILILSSSGADGAGGCGGCYIDGPGTSLSGCIFWANKDNGSPAESAQIYGVNASNPTITYCCIQNYSGADPHSFSANPLFVRPPNGSDYGDLHLLSSSPCIDKGPDGITDLGAYEYGNTTPQLTILLTDGALGLRSNRFGFNLSGTPGQTVVTETSTDLVTWMPLRTNTLETVPCYFSDPRTTTDSRRFYRLRVQ